MKINKAIILIDKYIAENYKKPTRCYRMNRVKFQQESYAHSAAIEIREFLNKHRKYEPIVLIENFRFAMDDLACTAKTSRQSFMFSVAYDVATDILDMLLMET